MNIANFFWYNKIIEKRKIEQKLNFNLYSKVFMVKQQDLFMDYCIFNNKLVKINRFNKIF